MHWRDACNLYTLPGFGDVFKETDLPHAPATDDRLPPAARRLISPTTVGLAHPPPAVVGLKLLMISDLHARRPRRRHEQLIQAVSAVDCDALLLVGDFMHRTAPGPLARQLLARLVEAAAPRRGAFGCFGNHDLDDFRRSVADLPVRWLNHDAAALAGVPLIIAGVDMVRRSSRVDLTAALLAAEQQRRSDDDLVVLISHAPDVAVSAADAAVPLVFSGHLHGGQLRLPGGIAIRNFNPWPTSKSAGVMRLGPTTVVLGRGLGESGPQPSRLFCPPHAPLVTLARDDGLHDSSSRTLEMIERW